MTNSADPDQLASPEADLDLHCVQNRVYPGSTGQGLTPSKVSKTTDLLQEFLLGNRFDIWQMCGKHCHET